MIQYVFVAGVKVYLKGLCGFNIYIYIHITNIYIYICVCGSDPGSQWKCLRDDQEDRENRIGWSSSFELQEGSNVSVGLASCGLAFSLPVVRCR